MQTHPVQTKNELGQPIGATLDWSGAAPPPRTTLAGNSCRLEPLDPDRHADELFEAFAQDTENRLWTYLPYGPFDSRTSFRTWLEAECLGDDPLFHAIVETPDGTAPRTSGLAGYLRIVPAQGVIEVGHLNFAPRLQRTRAATEAMYLLLVRAFDELGYRRYEWKCDALNGPSRRAATRLGFEYEGLFRQAAIYKERNRDTAWYSILDGEWPRLKAAYETWLAEDNFDADGRQKRSLSELTAAARTS